MSGRQPFPPDCVPEWRLGAYVDDGLESADVRRVETHLVSCEDCRRTVMALREEATVLAQALHGFARSGAESIALEAPARGVLMGLPLGIGAAIAVATAVSFVLEARMHAGIDWLHPARLMGVNDMFWNLVFLLRDDASGFVEFAVGLGALASVAALGTFVVGALSKRLYFAVGQAWAHLGKHLGMFIEQIADVSDKFKISDKPMSDDEWADAYEADTNVSIN